MAVGDTSKSCPAVPLTGTSLLAGAGSVGIGSTAGIGAGAAVSKFGKDTEGSIGSGVVAAVAAVFIVSGLFQARSLVWREFTAYFLSPIAYVVLVVFAIIKPMRRSFSGVIFEGDDTRNFVSSIKR